MTKRHKELLEWRKRYDDQRISQHNTFDKTLVALSTSALGASILLLTEFSRQGPLDASWYLTASWTCYVATIISTLFSFGAGAKDAAKEIELIDLEIVTGKYSDSSKNRFRKLTQWLNGISGILFVLATVWLLAFVHKNAFVGA